MGTNIKILPIMLILFLTFKYFIEYKKCLHLNGIIKNLFNLYCLYCLFLILKALLYDSNTGIKGNFITSFIGNLEFGILSFVIPISVLSIFEQNWDKAFIKTCDIIAYISIIIGILYLIGISIEASVFLLYLTPFMCFRQIIKSDKTFLYALYYILSTYYCYIEDERSILLMSFTTIIIFFLLKRFKNRYIIKYIKISCIIIPLAGLFLTLYNLFSEISFFEYLYNVYNDQTTMVNDTRTFLFKELNQDLSKTETWLYGKGMFGTYYSSVMEAAKNRGDYADNANRLGTECGYLWLLLKGGFTFLILYFLLFFSTILKAIKINNIVCLFIAFVIAIRLLFMFISLAPAFDISNIFLWAMFGIIATNRKKTNNKYLKSNQIDFYKSTK